MLDEVFHHYACKLARAVMSRFLRYAVVTPANDNGRWL